MSDTTEREAYVLNALHRRIDAITKGSTKKAATAIVMTCSLWSLPVIFPNDDPEEIATICKSLLRKGLIKQYSFKDAPSFVPVSRARITEVNEREMTQSDIL